MRLLSKSIARKILKIIGLFDIFKLKMHAIKDYGWENSAQKWESVDAAGLPIPWITYSMIDLLSKRVNKNMRIFEYGCGNSTLWWAANAHSVMSVEHNTDWYKKIKALVPDNVQMQLTSLHYDGDYCRTSTHGDPYDIIVIDGRDRVNCIKHSIKNLSDIGVIILDNSDREAYREGVEFLKLRGFRQLPLRGLAPIISHLSETSVFYRQDNCLNI
jgi:hypothetical protein